MYCRDRHRPIRQPEQDTLRVLLESAAQAGCQLGGVLGVLFVAVQALQAIFAALPSLVAEVKGFEFVGSVLTALLYFCLYLGFGVIVCAAVGAALGGVCTLFTGAMVYTAASGLLPMNELHLISRPFHRGLLYGYALGIITQLLWWLAALFNVYPYVWNPIVLLPGCTVSVGMMAACNAIFSIRAGHPDGPYRPLPRPFDSW